VCKPHKIIEKKQSKPPLNISRIRIHFSSLRESNCCNTF